MVFDEADALRAAIDAMVDGELIVAFYEKHQPLMALLESLGARPVLGLPSAPGPAVELSP